MRELFVFETVEKYRDRLLLLIEKCPEEKRDAVPAGFNNNIHWHIGHILTVTERLVFGLSGETARIPAEYPSFFGNGTKPGDWSEAPPAWETIVEQLTEQPKRIREAFTGRLDTPVKENFVKAEQVEELIVGHLLHEYNHAGSINAMLKVLNQG